MAVMSIEMCELHVAAGSMATVIQLLLVTISDFLTLHLKPLTIYI